MRASFWVIAPLVARMGEAKVSLPGGCAIGTRPVDLCSWRWSASAPTSRSTAATSSPRAKNGLKGGEITFPKVTVGGTHTALMAAALANGNTVIENAAREPEIIDLADCLNKMGARISGAGTAHILIEGVAEAQRRAPPRAARPHRDRHLCHGGRHDRRRRDARDARADCCRKALDVLAAGRRRINAPIAASRHAQRRRAQAGRGDDRAVPGLPDRPAGAADGADERASGHLAHHRDHLREPLHARAGAGRGFGARIQLDGETATIDGVDKLKGAPVMATDLRASVSLVIAALAAEGETMVNRVYHLDRGFERLEDKLSACGAAIERISG